MLRPSSMSCLLFYTIEVFLNNLSALDPRLCPAQGSSLTAPSSPIPHWFGIDTDPYPFVDAAGLVLRSRSSPKDIPFYRHEVSLSHNQKRSSSPRGADLPSVLPQDTSHRIMSPSRENSMMPMLLHDILRLFRLRLRFALLSYSAAVPSGSGRGPRLFHMMREPKQKLN